MKTRATAVAAAMVATLALLVSVSHAQGTEPRLPATPAGDVVQAWLDAVNSPDPQQIALIDERAVPIRLQSGGYDLVRIDNVSATPITAVLKDRLFGNDTSTTWTFSADTPLRITNIRTTPARETADAEPVARLDDAALGDFIRAAMERADYSGAVLVARDGKEVFAAAHGFADHEQNIANTLDTRFRVGSMNKMMTATAILQLVQAGKVRLDAPVGDYLKDYPNQDFARTVTVHHLLTHTGGAGDVFGPKFNENRLRLKTLADYVALYGDRAPEFTPGDRYRYSNYGFVLLGRIIEEVSGQNYPAYLDDHVFAPAGMTRSGFEPEDVAVEGRAMGYVPEGAGWGTNASFLPYSGTSAGGGYSTVRDLLAFANALTSHKLLDAGHTRLLTTSKTASGYAYGFGDTSTPEIRQYGHNGGAPGMNGDLCIIGDGKAVVVALSNVSPPSFADRFAGEIVERLKVFTVDGKLALLGPPAARPNAGEKERMAAFQAPDLDGDGRLDKAAYRELLKVLGFADQLETLFAQRDVNRDGFVSAEEYREPIPQ